MKKAKYISICTQKGGVGKSSFTTLFASFLHYQLGYNVAVIDCDFPQYSMHEMRERELENIPKIERLRKIASIQYSMHGKDAYVVESAIIKDAMTCAEKLEQAASLDIVFFDLPGTVNQEGILTLMSEMDYIISPIIADRVVLASSLGFLSMLNESIVKQSIGNLKGVYAFWNQCDGREKSPLYEMFSDVFKEYGISILSTKIPNLIRFHKDIADTEEIFRSTVLASNRQLLKSSKVEELIVEILSIINK